MALPQDLLRRPPREAVRRVALDLMKQIGKAASRLDDGGDEEALHDFRVGIRRLRSTLRAWREVLRGSKTKKRRRALEALQSKTGAARDTQVSLAWLRDRQEETPAAAGEDVARFAADLASKHEQAMHDVRAVVRKGAGRVMRKLRRALARMTVWLDSPEEALTFADALAGESRRGMQVLRDRLASVRSLADQDEAHRARIASKRLRYLLEPARSAEPMTETVLARLRDLQDVLGDLNDAHVLAPQMSTTPELEAHLDEHARGLFERLRTEWLEGGVDRLAEAVETLARRFDAVAADHVEIERKFLLDGVPETMPPAEILEIEQGWLPGTAIRERLRRIRTPEDTRFVRTVKTGHGRVRGEVEDETSEEVFASLWALTEGSRVTKRRHRVAVGERVWEIDEFLDRDLVLAEVELPEPAAEVVFPDWLAPHVIREVTEEVGYTNLSLAR